MTITDENYAAEGLRFVKTAKNADMPCGFMIEPNTDQWAAWEAYFFHLGRKSHRFEWVKKEHRINKSSPEKYMVPAEWPWEFDRNYSAVRDVPKVPYLEDA